MTVLVTDRQSYGITHREWTDQGYLRVPGRVARTGIQQYLAKELQLEDRSPNDVVNVYRPPEEVFSQDSLQSYEDVDVTDDHPSELVSADSFKEVAVGHATDSAYPEGEYVVAPLIIKDAEAIKAVENGKASLSAGYEAEYHHEPGQTADGTPYEFVQRNIRINHVALVDRARAGAEAKLLDHASTGGQSMATVTVDGRTVEVADNATAQLIQSAFDASNQSYKDMEAKAKEMEDEAARLREEMDKMQAEKDSANEELEKAKQAASDEAIAERIKSVQQTRDTATKIVGGEFTSDSVDPMQIKREALGKTRPTIDWSDKSDAYVTAAWDMAVEQAQQEPAKPSHDRLASDLRNLHTGDTEVADGTKAYSKFLSGEA